MNETRQEKFRALIATLMADLEAEDALGQQGQAIVTLDQQSVGRLSRMDALQSQAMAQATHARRNSQKAGLTAALQRIDAGEFGYCEECGDDIAEERLEFNPAVRICIGCAKG